MNNYLHCYADYRDCLGWKEQYEHDDIPDDWKMKAGYHKREGKGKSTDASSDLHSELQDLRSELQDLRSEFQDLRSELQDLRSELAAGKPPASSNSPTNSWEKANNNASDTEDPKAAQDPKNTPTTEGPYQ